MHVSERKAVDRAATLISSGASAPGMVRNLVKRAQASPGTHLTRHEQAAVLKFVRESDGAARAPRVKAPIMTEADRKAIESALALSQKHKPDDPRLRTFLANYSRGPATRVGEHTMGMVRRYLSAHVAERKPRTPKFPAPSELGLGLAGAMEMMDGEAAFELLRVSEAAGFVNRHINKHRVRQYEQDMRAGRWRLTGEPIIVGRSGQLMNGQHRLLAVIDSGVSVPMVVVRGVDADAFNSIDQAMPRKAADVVGIAGAKNRTVVASALKLLWIWEQHGPEGLAQTARGGSSDLSRSFTNEIAVEMYTGRPRIAESAAVAVKCSRLCPPSAAAFCHYLCSEKSRAAADDFFARLASGEDLKKGDPILALRQRLIAERRDPNTYVKGLTVVRMIMRIWNATRKGETLSKMPPMGDGHVQRPV